MWRALVTRRKVKKLSRAWNDAAKGVRMVNTILDESGASRALRHRVWAALTKGHVMPPEVSALMKGGLVR